MPCTYVCRGLPDFVKPHRIGALEATLARYACSDDTSTMRITSRKISACISCTNEAQYEGITMKHAPPADATEATFNIEALLEVAWMDYNRSPAESE